MKKNFPTTASNIPRKSTSWTDFIIQRQHQNKKNETKKTNTNKEGKKKNKRERENEKKWGKKVKKGNKINEQTSYENSNQKTSQGQCCMY